MTKERRLEGIGWRLDWIPNDKHRLYKVDSVVYFIKCEPLNKLYVGSTDTLHERMKKHFGDLALNQHHCHALQVAFNEFGLDSFRWGLLGNYDASELEAKEQYWIDELSKDKPFAIFNTKRIVTKSSRKAKP